MNKENSFFNVTIAHRKF